MDAIAVTMGELSRVLKNTPPPPGTHREAHSDDLVDLDRVLFPDGRPLVEKEESDDTP